jgi:predicted acyl esterase
LHLRGTLEGFKNIKSKDKWLEVHGQKKWQFYYEPEQVKKQLLFFDHFLLGKENDWKKQPKVNLEVREKYFDGKWQPTSSWPVENTQYRKLFLDASNATLLTSKPTKEALVEYSGAASGPGTHRAEFNFTFDKPTELVGHMAAKLYMSAPMTTDMDVFVAVWKIDTSGKPVPLAYYAQFEDGPVALGWLRASHRELDPERSTEYMPWLKHQREILFKKGEIVELDIEIWPSGTRFEKGEGLRFDVQGTDVMVSRTLANTDLEISQAIGVY